MEVWDKYSVRYDLSYHLCTCSQTDFKTQLRSYVWVLYIKLFSKKEIHPTGGRALFNPQHLVLYMYIYIKNQGSKVRTISKERLTTGIGNSI